MVNILDVVKIVNYILGATTLPSEGFPAADANADGTVNILDIVIIVNAILGQGPLGDD